MEGKYVQTTVSKETYSFIMSRKINSDNKTIQSVIRDILDEAALRAKNDGDTEVLPRDL